MTDWGHRRTIEPRGFSGMIDAYERVTGRVTYAMDVALPGMLHGKLLRSPHAHARLVSVDASRARALPGVEAVLTGPDLAARDDVFPYFGPIFRDQAVLAIDKVRYVGDPVAAVAAVDLDTAQAALELIDVVYDELPPVYAVEEAFAAGSPIVHDEPPRLGPTYSDIIVHTEGGTNVCNHFKLRKGDVDRGFAEADHVFEDVFTSPPVQHVPLETHNCVATISDGVIDIVTASQMPFMTRAILAEVFRVPQSRVRVRIHTLGGGYGAKSVKIEPVTALLAQAARRPVRLHLTREEEFVTITKHGVRIVMTTGVMNDGRIVARKSTCLFNTGAYADIGPRLIKNGGFATGGPHHIPNVWVDSYAVYTNIVPAGAF